MFIPDPPNPDFYPSRIPDPKTAKKEKGGKTLLSYLFVATNIKTLKHILFLNWREEKKFGPIYIEFYIFLPQKLSLNSPGPRSGTRKKPISDPGVKKAPDTGSWTLTVG
jgi:hypothetical protein